MLHLSLVYSAAGGTKAKQFHPGTKWILRESAPACFHNRGNIYRKTPGKCDIEYYWNLTVYIFYDRRFGPRIVIVNKQGTISLRQCFIAGERTSPSRWIQFRDEICTPLTKSAAKLG